MGTISVIGSGMLGVNQITTEGFSVIESVNRVFWIGDIAGLNEYLSHHEIHHEDLSYLYEDGGVDVDNYTRIIQYISEVLTECEHVCLIVPGHPRVGVTIVQLLQKLSQDGVFTLRCYPGISSFDAMINDIGIDPLEEGVSILDANRLIIYDYAMDPCINYFIYHVCSIGNSNTDYSSPQASNKVIYLKSKLLKHYPANTPIFLLSASTQKGQSADRLQGEICNIDTLLSKVTYKHTLYIPSSLPTKDRVNFEFLKEINVI
ncbi:Tetrapyrrole (Corrin/Porphyrin) Methylases [Serratia marcescens]|uniref:SAM-dependent methyltransferase n=1 Tax=Serratia marcescens TaxID=615 RepID=UPI001EF3E042|nr:SAM-dependent methyltransferase [Serratia marcescens]CAB5680482.1 Tetrapyrrole (Corrin/Porphyrin) Methylases [Serratia marcescens]CAB5697014.1 Tetrapyrrole (Corrin/Porphyrin) Methylases [Serratia marcescens]